MDNSHGSLENVILKTIWDIEENNNSTNVITVNNVYSVISATNKQRAYTTIKTVMDRLVDKQILKRVKAGKKFIYKSRTSRSEAASSAIKKIADIYYNNDLKLLNKAIEKECQKIKV